MRYVELAKATILTETQTRQQLRILGIKGESFDTINRRLIEVYRKIEAYRKFQRKERY
jgi:hypothetical protein